MESVDEEIKLNSFALGANKLTTIRHKAKQISPQLIRAQRIEKKLTINRQKRLINRLKKQYIIEQKNYREFTKSELKKERSQRRLRTIMELMDKLTTERKKKTQVGMVFQRPRPFRTSIFENVAYSLKCHGIRDQELTKCLVKEALMDVAL
ncbi:hypothetical protein DICVIV_11883 [Dictyocaulus viviparus]|uniref:Uncharacterized protein n=1 Tax=Dictyocaulus viviparus TaxID=29172 RepID=A0A0D8XII4_DICVI|nr:hypothetical protein DICVIV_11883 [Dictyocaulus viviparus]